MEFVKIFEKLTDNQFIIFIGFLFFVSFREILRNLDKIKSIFPSKTTKLKQLKEMRNDEIYAKDELQLRVLNNKIKALSFEIATKHKPTSRSVRVTQIQEKLGFKIFFNSLFKITQHIPKTDALQEVDEQVAQKYYRKEFIKVWFLISLSLFGVVLYLLLKDIPTPMKYTFLSLMIFAFIFFTFYYIGLKDEVEIIKKYNELVRETNAKK